MTKEMAPHPMPAEGFAEGVGPGIDHAPHCGMPSGTHALLCDDRPERKVCGILRAASEMFRAGQPEQALRFLTRTPTRLGFMPLAVVSHIVRLCLQMRREDLAARQCLDFAQQALALGYENLGMEAASAAMVLDAQADYELTRTPETLREVARLYEQVACRHLPSPSPSRPSLRRKNGPLRVALLVPNLVDDVVAYTKRVLQFARHADSARYLLNVYVSENSTRRTSPLFPVGCLNPGSEQTGAGTLRKLRDREIPVFLTPRSLPFVEAAGVLASQIEEDGMDMIILQTGIAFPIDWLATSLARIPVKVGIHIGTSLCLPGLDATFYDNPANIEREAVIWEPDMGARLLLRKGTDLDEINTLCPPDRSRFGIPPQAVVIGTLSNHLHRRMSPAYLHAIASVLRERPNAWFLAFGADAVPAATAFFESQGVAGRIRFGGRKERVGEALKSLDVYANEFPVGGSQSVIEAIACGVPVVAMKWSDAHPESAGAEIVGGRHAVPARDTEAYAALLRHWIDVPSARAIAARDLQARAHKLFSAQKYVTSLLQQTATIYWEKHKALAA